MESADEKEASEILRSLLSVSKVQNPQISEMSYWQQADGSFQPQEQIVWQIDSSEMTKRRVVNDTRNIIHHIPVTYVTTDGRSFTKNTDKPLTYVVSHNVITENAKYQKVNENEQSLILNEPQKIVLIQELDPKLTEASNVYSDVGSTVNVMETRLFKVGNGSAVYSTSDTKLCVKNEGDCQIVDIENNNNEEEITVVTEVAELPEAEAPCSTINNVKRKASLEVERTPKRNKQKKIEHCLEGDGKIRNGADGCLKETKKDRKNIGRKKKLNRRTSLKLKNKMKKGGKVIIKKGKKTGNEGLSDKEEQANEGLKLKGSHNELTKLEENAEQVEERFKIGCECSDYNCFDGLNAEKVFRHRLNIADLTKAEHDMYLMGVIMASMQNPDETCRHKERIRIRSSYAYQGKKVCLTAFLYLEHVTLYQMKRLRKHLKYHGVSPRIHGNHGRKPANTLSLDIYQHATNFVQSYIEKHSVKNVPNFTTFSSNKVGNTFISGTNLNLHDSSAGKPGKKPKKIKIANKMTSYHLPPECTKKTVHDEYKTYCEGMKPDQKVMQYSTFTSFLKKQFPNVKFQKTEKFNQSESKTTTGGNQSEEVESKQKNKRQKKIVELFESRDVQTVQTVQTQQTKSIQTLQYPQNKNIHVPPPPLIRVPKQNQQTFCNRTQTIAGPFVKSSQIVLNGQHVQFCSSGNSQLQPDIRLQDQVLVGNHVINAHCVDQTPTYTQQIYSVHNINDN